MWNWSTCALPVTTVFGPETTAAIPEYKDSEDTRSELHTSAFVLIQKGKTHTPAPQIPCGSSQMWSGFVSLHLKTAPQRALCCLVVCRLQLQTVISVFTQENPPPPPPPPPAHCINTGGRWTGPRSSSTQGDSGDKMDSCPLWGSGGTSWIFLTELVFAGVVWDLHDVEFEALVALPDGVDAGDVRTLLAHRLHELWEQRSWFKSPERVKSGMWGKICWVCEWNPWNHSYSSWMFGPLVPLWPFSSLCSRGVWSPERPLILGLAPSRRHQLDLRRKQPVRFQQLCFTDRVTTFLYVVLTPLCPPCTRQPRISALRQMVPLGYQVCGLIRM